MCTVVLLHGCVQTTAVDSAIYVQEAIDGEPRWLGGPAAAPVWAPTENSVAWATEDGLYRHDLTTNQQTLLTAQASAGRPAWSPDSGALAYVDRVGEALVVLDAQSGAVQFTAPVATEDAGHRPLALPALGGPSWSPDGSRLAFNCWDGHGDEICVVRADGTGYRQLTHIETRKSTNDPPPGALVLAASNAGPPVWSPDGVELAVAVYPEQRGAPAGVFVIDLEGGTARRVTSLLPNSEITWFADGESLLFSASDKGRSDALRIPVPDGEPVKLTAKLTTGAREPALSAGDALLAVASGGNVVVLDMDGNLKGTAASGLTVRQPSWSPDGRRVAFAAAPDPLASFS